jgi:hypothetical protein
MPLERIDTHAHFIPPFYRTASEEQGNGQPDGMPAIPVSDHPLTTSYSAGHNN